MAWHCYFEHAQNKRCGLAFPQRVRQHAVATLWGLLECRERVVSASRARCKDAVLILHLELAFAMHFDNKSTNHLLKYIKYLL